MCDTGSFERLETVNSLLLMLEQDLCAGAPADASHQLQAAASGLAGAVRDFRIADADPKLRASVIEMRERCTRLRVLLERGESFCAARLNHLAVSSGSYSPDGAPAAYRFRGLVETEG